MANTEGSIRINTEWLQIGMAIVSMVSVVIVIYVGSQMGVTLYKAEQAISRHAQGQDMHEGARTEFAKKDGRIRMVEQAAARHDTQLQAVTDHVRIVEADVRQVKEIVIRIEANMDANRRIRE